jgi:hypothetical protein
MLRNSEINIQNPSRNLLSRAERRKQKGEGHRRKENNKENNY